jgi:hypothetical protein
MAGSWGSNAWDFDRDGRSDVRTFYGYGPPVENPQTIYPHGVEVASTVGGWWKFITESSGVTIEKYTSSPFASDPDERISPFGKLIDLSFPAPHTPLSVSVNCSDAGGGNYDCTATPSNGQGSVEYIWDCDGDWEFDDEPASVKNPVHPLGWWDITTVTCPSSQVESGGEIHVLAEELGGIFIAVDTYDVP